MTSILLFGLLAALANVVGGLVLVKAGGHRWGERSLKYLVALGAGFMLAAIFIEILPETIGLCARPRTANPRRGGAPSMTLCSLGIVYSVLRAHARAALHFGAETHPESSFDRPRRHRRRRIVDPHLFDAFYRFVLPDHFKVGILVFNRHPPAQDAQVSPLRRLCLPRPSERAR